nr:XRE family transcriptional regulator [Duganella violaceicalia]
MILLITKIIRDNGWKQAEAAEHCGVAQPRVNDLLRGRVSRFYLDALVNIVSALGLCVHFSVRELEAA